MVGVVDVRSYIDQLLLITKNQKMSLMKIMQRKEKKKINLKNLKSIFKTYYRRLQRI